MQASGQAQTQAQTQAQRLAMTPQLTQSIALLAMSAGELDAFVAEVAERNPLLKLRRPVPRSHGTALPDWTERRQAPRRLADHLCEQIALAAAPREVAAAARAIAHDLDERGRLPDPHGLRDVRGVSPSTFEGALALVRSLEPAGVGARDLADCLALQLARLDRLDPAMAVVVANLAMIADGRHVELAERAGLSFGELLEAVRELKALDPAPGERFVEEPAPLIPPDVVVRAERRGDWHVALNADVLPRAIADRAYHASVGHDPAARPWADAALAEATWLERALDQRARTLLAVTRAIVREQDAFLRHGEERLRPLTLQRVADAVGVHESTVSRITTAKTVLVPGGMFALKHFFSAALAGTDGEAHAARAVQARIRALVAREGEDVLSDDAIVARLEEQGVRIARRTVAKYRDVLGLPSSVQRRRLLRVPAV